MKAKVGIFVCILLVLCVGLVFAQTTKKVAVKDYLAEFEKFVVEVEKAAEKKDASKYMEYGTKYGEFIGTKLQNVDSLELMKKDNYEKYTSLCTRYSTAITSLATVYAMSLYKF